MANSHKFSMAIKTAGDRYEHSVLYGTAAMQRLAVMWMDVAMAGILI